MNYVQGKIICKIILFSLMLNSMNLTFEDNRITKTKVLSCIGLARARYELDKEYLDHLSIQFEKVYKTPIKEPDHKHILTMGLVNCFPKIKIDQAQALMDLINQNGKIDPFTVENRNLLQLDNIEKMGIPKNYIERLRIINRLLQEIGDDYELLKEEDNKMSEKYVREITSQVSFLSYTFDKMFLVFKLLGIDSYIGLLLLIVLLFFGIRQLRHLRPFKKKRKIIVKTTNENESQSD